MTETKPKQAKDSRVSALGRLGQRAFSGRIPVVLQLNIVECGAACLTMVLEYYSKHVRLAEVREKIGVSRDGSNALAILNAARHYGLRARGARIDLDELRFLPKGSILHWEFNHFLVFERFKRDHMYVVDPAVGRRRIPLERVKKSFTGVALLFEPGGDFNASQATQALFGVISRVPLLRVAIG